MSIDDGSDGSVRSPPAASPVVGRDRISRSLLRRSSARLLGWSPVFRIARRLSIGVDLVLCKELDGALTEYHARVPVEVAIASKAEVVEAARLRSPEDRWTDVYQSRWRHGHKCFVAKVASTVIASNWLIFRAEVDGHDFTVAGQDEVMCSDAFTTPEWRGNGIHTLLLFRMLEWARASGYRTAYTEIAAAHRDSLVSHRRLGWEIAAAAIKGRFPRGWHWNSLLGSVSHPRRGELVRHKSGGTKYCLPLVLRRYTDRLPSGVTWVRTRESLACRTEIFVLDPAWDVEIAQVEAVIHHAVTRTLSRLGRESAGQNLTVTILLGDNVLTSELHRRACGNFALSTMVCFAEDVGRVSNVNSIGVLAIALQALTRDAQTRQTCLARCLALTVIEGILSLVGHADARAVAAEVAHTIGDGLAE